MARVDGAIVKRMVLAQLLTLGAGYSVTAANGRQPQGTSSGGAGNAVVTLLGLKVMRREQHRGGATGTDPVAGCDVADVVCVVNVKLPIRRSVDPNSGDAAGSLGAISSALAAVAAKVDQGVNLVDVDTVHRLSFLAAEMTEDEQSSDQPRLATGYVSVRGIVTRSSGTSLQSFT